MRGANAESKISQIKFRTCILAGQGGSDHRWWFRHWASCSQSLCSRESICRFYISCWGWGQRCKRCRRTHKKKFWPLCKRAPCNLWGPRKGVTLQGGMLSTSSPAVFRISYTSSSPFSFSTTQHAGKLVQPTTMSLNKDIIFIKIDVLFQQQVIESVVRKFRKSRHPCQQCRGAIHARVARRCVHRRMATHLRYKHPRILLPHQVSLLFPSPLAHNLSYKLFTQLAGM